MLRAWKEFGLDAIIIIVFSCHLLLSPFTKVEESFNIQACHDILYHGIWLNQYDHLEFPGVVPRTFIGPLMVSALSFPFVLIIKIFGLPKFYSQYIIRFVLGFLVFLAWRGFRKRVFASFGTSVTVWFTVLTASQFHFMYYLSRPLPNIFALIFVLIAYSYWLEQQHEYLIPVCGIAAVIFRSELVMLLGPIFLIDLINRHISIIRFLKIAVPAGIVCLTATVIVDSIFWGRILWPEGEVFLFNTYYNQSHHWGTLPLLWYWYSALPRAMGLSLLLVPLGIIIDKRIKLLAVPVLLFIALFSLLDHKELRFIIYALPLLNVAAARAAHFLWISRYKSTIHQFVGAGTCLHILGNCIFTLLLLSISSKNYPGGEAILKLHQIVPNSELVNVHIDNYAAQTGVSRFMQLNSQWRYNKTENLKAGSAEIRHFTHLIVEAKSKYAYNLKHYIETHEILASVDGFSHLNFNYNSYPPVKVRVKPSIFILRNLQEGLIDWTFADSDDLHPSQRIKETLNFAHDSNKSQRVELPKNDAEDREV